MRLVDRQVLRELIAPFFFGVAAFSSVFFAGSLLVKLTNWIMSGMSISTAVKLVVLSLPMIVVYTLPMATLLAVLLGVGRLSGESEVVALFASGVSFYRLMLPIIALGLAVSLCAVALEEVVAPQTNAWTEDIKAAFAQEVKIGDRPFTVMIPSSKTQVTVLGGMDLETGVLRDVTITQFGDDGPTRIIHAARAEWAGIKDPEARYRWRLYDGWWDVPAPSTGSAATGRFERARSWEVQIRKTPKDMSLYQKEAEQMTFRELSSLIKHVRAHPDRSADDVRKLDVDRWNKLALPFSSLVFAMLAAPLGIRPHRSSSSVGLGLSIFLILVYWLVWRYTTALAATGTLPPLVGAFVADVLGIAVALWLVKRAAK